MQTYVDWMHSCWYVTFMADSVISVPAGFTASGLPDGLLAGRVVDGQLSDPDIDKKIIVQSDGNVTANT